MVGVDQIDRMAGQEAAERECQQGVEQQQLGERRPCAHAPVVPDVGDAVDRVGQDLAGTVMVG